MNNKHAYGWTISWTKSLFSGEFTSLTFGEILTMSPKLETAENLVRNISESPRETTNRVATLNYNINHALDKTYLDKARKLVRLT